MTWLALGLALFLGIHMTRAVAPRWRQAQIARLGEQGWKGLYTVVSLVGFGLILWGFSRARLTPVALWPRIPGMNHAAAALMVVAMILMAAAYVPRNHIKARLQHPMTLSVKVWAFAHLIANNTLADVMLFGSFLVWSILVFRAARRRPAPVLPPPTAAGTAATVVAGLALWAFFAFWAHAAWLGIAPLGR
ncbi:NnrU family protein [Pelomonas sp. P7]|uniref:NnrU family protein n=1 Tax=Pelomonas caseinilytica TaxID=2906763 RepID=A0ABS8XFD1_9BURK|nr:NnrU family protein [Pelomonas sp. P7]MCE4539597.1 NnrU family protein [Pelomonas sp. P7]